MLLSETTGILYQSDHFWGNSNLNTLRMLMSTCKEFNAELRGEAKKKQKKGAPPQPVSLPIIEAALLSIIRLRPLANSSWGLSFNTAKYQFSLQASVLIAHCSALPAADRFHLSDAHAAGFKGGYYHFAQISFIDAHLLASKKTGLKIAMARRHQFEVKLIKSAREVIAAVDGRLTPLRCNVRAAGIQLKKDVDTLRKDVVGKKKVPGENTLRLRMRMLTKLHDDIRLSEYKLAFIKRSLAEGFFNIALKIKELKALKKVIVCRYKSHSNFCPVLMPLSFVSRME